MRVALFAQYADQSYGFGISRYVYNLVNALNNNNIATSIYDSPFKHHRKYKSFFDYFCSTPAQMLLSSSEYDIYHLTVPQAGFGVLPYRITHNKPLVTTIYDLHPLLFGQFNKGFALVEKPIRYASEKSDHLIAISSLTKKDIVKYYDVDPDHVTITPLGVADKFRKIDIPHSKFTVGYIGGFQKNKNVELILRAYAIFESYHNDTQLLIYGKGVLLDEYKKLASELKIKNVLFMGFAPENRIVEIYNSFDIFMFPSECEGVGLPILEAQKCRVPTIVLSNARIPEEVSRYCKHGKDEYELCIRMNEIYENKFWFSEDHLKHIDSFTWKNCAIKTIEAYNKVLK